jgi:hypothetical protein
MAGVGLALEEQGSVERLNRDNPMKRLLLILLLMTVHEDTAYSQGRVLFSNYFTPPYNQVIWYPFEPGTYRAVNEPSLQVQVWYAEGVVTDPQILIPGALVILTLLSRLILVLVMGREDIFFLLTRFCPHGRRGMYTRSN